MRTFLKFNRLYKTLRHLKFIQYIYRLKKLIPIKVSIETLDPTPIQKNLSFTWPSINNKQSFDGIDFNFLNRKQRFSEDIWMNQSEDDLWNYNLHYFDFLNEEKSQKDPKIIHSWIDNTLFGKGLPYEPYPTSLRIVNQIKWILSNNIKNNEINKSLFLQSRWLNRNLEFHLLANHLFSNFKALFFAGYFFNSKESDFWFLKGKKGIINQIKEQVLDDGGHFELSPMYHNLFIKDLIDIYMLNTLNKTLFDKDFGEILTEAITSMLGWSGAMSHPDGDISFFNDSCFGIAPTMEELQKYSSSFH